MLLSCVLCCVSIAPWRICCMSGAASQPPTKQGFITMQGLELFGEPMFGSRISDVRFVNEVLTHVRKVSTHAGTIPYMYQVLSAIVQVNESKVTRRLTSPVTSGGRILWSSVCGGLSTMRIGFCLYICGHHLGSPQGACPSMTYITE